MPPSRRMILSGGAAALALPARAETPIELRWEDLVPLEARGSILSGVIGHEQAFGMSREPQDAPFTDAYDDKLVALPGFAIPLDYDGLGSKVMILAPFIGACIHVPPPPPNQLVLVEAEKPYPVEELFDPIRVTGIFNRFGAKTELAEIGYRMKATRIEAFEP